MKTFYGLSRTRNRKGEIIRRTLKPIVNCLTPSCTGGTESRWVLVVEAIFDNGDESTEVHPGVEVQPEWLGVPDGGGKPHHQLRCAPRMRTEDSDSK